MNRTSELFQTACIWEAVARKVGNVHRGADFKGTALTDFLLSAAASARAFDSATIHPVGLTVELAARATREAVGQNTNLGILLLLAPLAAATGQRGRTLREAAVEVVENLTLDDSVRVYHAIRLANPGGLGNSPDQDVKNRPTVPLRQAMALATDRDLIARQYANGFVELFEVGVPAFLLALEKFRCVEAAVIECHLRWMAAFPDSLIARKCGLEYAEEIRRRAAGIFELGGLDSMAGRQAAVALDRDLREDGNRRNPGTSADLVTACLFVALHENKVKPSASFRWSVSEWL